MGFLHYWCIMSYIDQNHANKNIPNMLTKIKQAIFCLLGPHYNKFLSIIIMHNMLNKNKNVNILHLENHVYRHNKKCIEIY